MMKSSNYTARSNKQNTKQEDKVWKTVIWVNTNLSMLSTSQKAIN